MIVLNKEQIEKVKKYYIKYASPVLPKVLTLNYYTYIVKLDIDYYMVCVDDENGEQVEVLDFYSLDDLFFGGY